MTHVSASGYKRSQIASKLKDTYDDNIFYLSIHGYIYIYRGKSTGTMPSNFFFYVSVGHYQSLTVESARKKVLWENNLDQDRTSKRYTCVCCCIFSTRSLMYLRMGTHDRVWSRHTLTQPKATPSPVIWFELFLTS